jgi:hypothetical protein
MNSDWPAIPCGLVARSFFNDTFKLYKSTYTKILIPIDESGIAWKSDIENSFRNINDDEIKELNEQRIHENCQIFNKSLQEKS